MPDTTTIPVNVILASNSPRRKQLLEEAGVKFTVYTGSTEVDESLDADQRSHPSEAVKKLAERKAGSVIQDILAENPVGLGIVIGADTTVVLDGEMLGKPHSADHAREMLGRLSGRTHEVITGVSVWLVMLNESEEKRRRRQCFVGLPLVLRNQHGYLQRAFDRRYQRLCCHGQKPSIRQAPMPSRARAADWWKATTATSTTLSAYPSIRF